MKAHHSSAEEELDCEDLTRSNPKWEAWDVMLTIAMDISSQAEFREYAKILIAMLYDSTDDDSYVEQVAEVVQTMEGHHECGAYYLLETMCSAKLFEQMTDAFRLIGKANNIRASMDEDDIDRSFASTVHDGLELYDALETELLLYLTPPGVDFVLAGLKSYHNEELLLDFFTNLDYQCGYNNGSHHDEV